MPSRRVYPEKPRTILDRNGNRHKAKIEATNQETHAAVKTPQPRGGGREGISQPASQLAPNRSVPINGSPAASYSAKLYVKLTCPRATKKWRVLNTQSMPIAADGASGSMKTARPAGIIEITHRGNLSTANGCAYIIFTATSSCKHAFRVMAFFNAFVRCFAASQCKKGILPLG